MRLLVTGTTGKIARSLIARSAAAGVEVQAVGRPSLDLARPADLAAAVRSARPDIIVSAAACANVAEAEANPDLAAAINVDGAEALAVCARGLGAPIIHLSTSYVFDGIKSEPYRESDPTRPLNVYGRTKLLGEQAVAQAQPEHVNLRLSWVYSEFGWNFVTAILQQASAAEELRVVADQVANPTSAADIADGIIAVGKNLLSGRLGREGYGTFHLSAPDVVTPAQFAVAVLTHSAAHGGPSARIVEITRDEYATEVARPANAALDSGKIADIHGVSLPSLDVSLPPCVEKILRTKA